MNTIERGRISPTLRLLMRIPVPWVFVLGYLIGVCLEVAFPPHFLKGNLQYIKIGGALVLVLGAIIAGWGLKIFFTQRTTTVPGKKSSMLVTWGPYRFTRNPMYLGLSIAYVGEAGILKQVWPLAILPLLWVYLNFVVIPVEETRLMEVFGDEFKRYRMKVRRWI